jgi:hypothetical protein
LQKAKVVMKPIEIVRDEHAASIVRICFESAGHLRRHLRPGDRRTLLFCPAVIAVGESEPVVLDLSFLDNDQHCLLRGRALPVDHIDAPGCWLEFDDEAIAGVFRAAALPRRGQRRYPAGIAANVSTESGASSGCRILDVGTGGARLTGVSLEVSPGDRIRLAPFGPGDRSGPRAIAVWARGSEIGIRFAGAGATQRTAVVMLVGMARACADAALEIAHPPTCRCLPGNPAEEPAPLRVAASS